jgi:hypothetical protein
VHTAHRYRTGGTGTRGMGLRDLLAGEDKEPGANGESIPAEKKVARGREVIPGHLRYRPPSSSARVAHARVGMENDRRRRHGR